jgi:hypothetical protein
LRGKREGEKRERERERDEQRNTVVLLLPAGAILGSLPVTGGTRYSDSSTKTIIPNTKK